MTQQRNRKKVSVDAIALTVEDVAAKLKIPVTTARKLVVAGKIQGFKVGNRWRVRNADFDNYIDGRISAAARPQRRDRGWIDKLPGANRFR